MALTFLVNYRFKPISAIYCRNPFPSHFLDEDVRSQTVVQLCSDS